MTTDVSTDIKSKVNGRLDWHSPIVLGIELRSLNLRSRRSLPKTWFTLILISAGRQADLRVSNPQTGFIWEAVERSLYGDGVMLFAYLNGCPHTDLLLGSFC